MPEQRTGSLPAIQQRQNNLYATYTPDVHLSAVMAEYIVVLVILMMFCHGDGWRVLIIRNLYARTELFHLVDMTVMKSCCTAVKNSRSVLYVTRFGNNQLVMDV